jgi:HSP20 family protein
MSVSTRTPMREIDALRERFDRLFSEMTAGPKAVDEQVTMPLDVKEMEKEIVVTATVPGFKPEELEVDISRGVLSVRGKTETEKEETEGTWHVRERRFGAVQRAISLPVPVYEDEAKARYENGVLTITLPKSEQAPRRHVPIEPV